MRKIRYIGIFLCTLFLFTACEQETEGISGILHFEIKGDQTMLVTLGTSYVEPGCYVTYRDKDVTSTVKVAGTVDPNTVGLYPLEYSVVNEDGVKTTRSRTVIVSDPTVVVDIAGEYVTVAGTHRLREGDAEPYLKCDVTIKKIAPGFFAISDFLGGYYYQFRTGYSANYVSYGYVQLENNGNITLLSSSLIASGWAETLSELRNGKYTPSDGSVSWDADYSGMTFTVVLNKKKID